MWCVWWHLHCGSVCALQYESKGKAFIPTEIESFIRTWSHTLYSRKLHIFSVHWVKEIRRKLWTLNINRSWLSHTVNITLKKHTSLHDQEEIASLPRASITIQLNTRTRTQHGAITASHSFSPFCQMKVRPRHWHVHDSSWWVCWCVTFVDPRQWWCFMILHLACSCNESYALWAIRGRFLDHLVIWGYEGKSSDEGWTWKVGLANVTLLSTQVTFLLLWFMR